MDVSAILARLAQLNDRVAALEEWYKEKKGISEAKIDESTRKSPKVTKKKTKGR